MLYESIDFSYHLFSDTNFFKFHSTISIYLIQHL